MSITATVTFDDPAGAFVAYYPMLTTNTVAAASRWAQYFESNSALEIQIDFNEQRENVLASAGSARTVFLGELNGLEVFQQGAAYEICTGTDPNGAMPDVSIHIAATPLIADFWFDPLPGARSAPPRDKYDAFSILMHEIGHALGFASWRDSATGQLPARLPESV